MSNITNTDPVVTESKLTEFYEDIKPFLGCPAYITQEGDEMYYSTEEKVVGRWVDGKPVYQKVYVDQSISKGSNIYDISALNIDTLVNLIITTGLYNSTTVSKRIFPDDEHEAFINSAGKLDIESTPSGTFNKCNFIIYYTKTTDSAVTTIETKPTHYSTDEQVVGTWIDGKPLYQKTVTVTSPTSDFGIIYDYDATFDIKDLRGYLTGTDNAVWDLNVYFPNNFSIASYIYKPNHDIRMNVTRASEKGVPVVLTLQYTKSTD